MKKEEIQALNFPEINLKELYDKFSNRFLLSVGVAKRARQLKEGARPLVQIAHNEPFNPISIAMKELLEGRVNITIDDDKDDADIFINELDAGLEEDLKLEDGLEEKAEKDLKKKESKRKSKSLSA